MAVCRNSLYSFSGVLSRDNIFKDLTSFRKSCHEGEQAIRPTCQGREPGLAACGRGGVQVGGLRCGAGGTASHTPHAGDWQEGQLPSTVPGV